MHRIIAFDNVLNVRDFGGHELGDGTQVVSGKLLRGAQLSKMTDKDIERLRSRHVETLVDFRYLPERLRQPSRMTQAFRPDILHYEPHLDQQSGEELAPHERFAIEELQTAADAHRYMVQSYTERPHSPAFIDLTARALRQMAEHGGSVYVHCAAGKDRTGTFVAIVLGLLGVNPDDIMDEYLRTRDAVDIDNIMDFISREMSERYGREFSPAILRPYFAVEPDYLEASLKGIGNVEVYAQNVLGLEQAHMKALRENYILPNQP